MTTGRAPAWSGHCLAPSPCASRRIACALWLAVSLSGCNDTRDLAPPSPYSPWHSTLSAGDDADRPAGRRASQAEPGPGNVPRYDLPRDPLLPIVDPHPAIEPAHSYTLVELVDIAQRNNKQTRIVWEQARQAAINVGISRSAYLPSLTLSALGGDRRETSPFPNNLNESGYITSNAVAIFPALTISYLLLDFGARDAAVRAARETSEAANVAFTGVHQQLILSVARGYFSLQAAEAQLVAAQSSLGNADLIATAARARLDRGEGTVTDVDDAARDVAQARYSIASARATRDTTRDTLLETLGLPPRTALLVETLADFPIPHGLSGTLDGLIQQGLRSRPDLLADLARLRASEADTARARAELYPTVSLNLKGSGDIGRLSTEGFPAQIFIAPEAGIYLDFNWTFYQGGAKANQVRLAESRQSEQRDALEAAEDQAMREVAVAYDELDAGLVQYEAAAALQQAARTSFASSAEAFRHGVGTITAADSAASALAQADATLARTHAQVLTSSAALAFATGALTSTSSLSTSIGTSPDAVPVQMLP